MSSSSSAESTTRFGARAVLAAVGLALVAVPYGLTLLLVEEEWAPLLRADLGTSQRLHDYAVIHAGFVRGTAVTVAALAVLAIGFSRIALGVHYVSDVVGGFVLGAAWVAAIAAAVKRMRGEHGRGPVALQEGLEPDQAVSLVGHLTGDAERDQRQ